MFRDYKGNIMWGEVGFAGFILTIVCLAIVFLHAVITMSNERMDKHKAFKETCIDAGGYPVSPFDYVKGHGDGYLCINPSAIIQLKDEVK